MNRRDFGGQECKTRSGTELEKLLQVDKFKGGIRFGLKCRGENPPLLLFIGTEVHRSDEASRSAQAQKSVKHSWMSTL